VLKRVFGPKRDEVTRGWRNEVLRDLRGACSTNEEKRKACGILVGRPKGKEATGKTKT
jgi:hypothetical protein